MSYASLKQVKAIKTINRND